MSEHIHDDPILRRHSRHFREHTRVLDTDPIMKTRTMFHTDVDGNFRIWTEQDVDQVTDIAREEYKMGRRRFNDFATHVARVPVAVWEHWVKQGITKDPERLRKALNDPDNRYFRTMPGRL